MRKLVLLAAAVGSMWLATGSAEARRHWSEWADAGSSAQVPFARSDRSARSERQVRGQRGERARGVGRRTRHAEVSFGNLGSLSGGSGLGPRPRQWCGWWMRSQLGGGPAYNLAWNWRNYGSPTTPQVGAVVVWRHHVGIITGQAGNGQWIVKSGNDSGAVRERARSVSGAIFRI